MQPADNLSQVRFIVLVDHFMTDEEVDDEEDGPVTPFRGVRADLREDFSGADQLWLTGSEAYRSQLLLDTYRNTSAAKVLLGRTRLLHRVAWVDTPRQLSGQTSACSQPSRPKYQLRDIFVQGGRSTYSYSIGYVYTHKVEKSQGEASQRKGNSQTGAAKSYRSFHPQIRMTSILPT